jgi:hypothetical protein
VIQSVPSIGQTKPAIKQATNLLIEEGNLQSDFVSFEVLFHDHSSFAIIHLSMFLNGRISL